jgi:hypothetical protein
MSPGRLLVEIGRIDTACDRIEIPGRDHGTHVLLLKAKPLADGLAPNMG